ncbi:flagellar basal body P-ring formation protein FlgA [Salipiger sp. P9]|uniref:flagellar basal body P-ring formation chaperone FlgA n=1 Tax=Salipiger pentaromativorans TaxID=2943193 RepID=UPI002157E321|nr:flagellar basal body P-ring formation chaperone FlgA [Salipiger pentaromativorans]MCR8549510.1 flagellar basal body P-ring formation protein FlgA [Salipiger pentaromativorans]
MRWLALLLGLYGALPALAETVVVTKTIRAQDIVTADAVRLDPAPIPGAYAALGDVIGQEARITLYPGRPVMLGAVGEPALIDRNQIVELVFVRGGLRIVTEGRALARGSAGERIRVMNMASRSTLFGTVTGDGTVTVSNE